MARINFFRLTKNKKFNYTPRYYKGKEEKNIYDFGSKIAKSRETYNDNDFRNQWATARTNMRTRKNRSVSKRLILIVLILVLIFLYIIDFDYAIFLQ